METIKKEANKIARRYGHGRATEIIFSPEVKEGKVVESVSFGYRKCTTDEYVPNAYRYNFGWKNTYYQRAVCKVCLPSQLLLFKKFKG